MKKDLVVIGVLVVIIAAGAVLFNINPDTEGEGGSRDMGRKEGVVTLALGESARFEDLTITPLELIEDSRCAIDMVCVWAGTVRVKLQTVSGMGTSEQAIEIGKSITTEAEEVKFLAVAPSRKESEPAPDSDYRFTFEVRERALVEVNPPATGTNPGGAVSEGRCYVGGCSSQLCTEEPGMASTCEYRAEYACYQGARCERQNNGQCGWTQTNELRMCLENPPSL